jgi:hypothetical protein
VQRVSGAELAANQLLKDVAVVAVVVAVVVDAVRVCAKGITRRGWGFGAG